MKGLKSLIVYTLIVVAVSAAYYVYLHNVHPPTPERETLLSEIGEVFGEIALWVLGFIYFRTILKVIMGKGAIARRLLPEYSPPPAASQLNKFLAYLNRTHIYVGIAGVAVVVLHVALMGLPLDILFFPVVLALVVWQGLFGMFLSWKFTPTELKRFSYLVHAQFSTGILIGVFAYFGHLLVDN